jgi:hypothetical protein
MAVCDIFVFHDNVQITKSGPTRRVKISAKHTSDHTQWLTVPLNKHSDYSLIKDLDICWEYDWMKKHLAVIYETYRMYPYFDEYFPQIEEWYKAVSNFTNLSEMNCYFIRQIMKFLSLNPQLFYSSLLPINGKGNEYNLSLAKYLGGTHYVSGKGSGKYQDEDYFLSEGIQIIAIDSMKIMHSTMNRMGIEYYGLNLSFLDCLFMLGKSNLLDLLHLNNNLKCE